MRKFTSYENIGLLLGNTGVGALSDTESSFNQLNRVQSAGHSFSFDRIDLNQVSSFRGVDIPVVSQADVQFTASYILTSGQNEQALGFYTGEDQSCLYDLYNAGPTGASRSIFIVSSDKEINREINLSQDLSDTIVIGLGNAFLNSYSMQASVGDFPSADINFSCSNIKFDTNANTTATGTCPSVNFESGNFEGMPNYEISASSFGKNVLPVTAVRPGDITLDLDEIQFGQSLSSSLTTVAVQSISIDLPIPRNALNGFGSNYVYGRKMVFPTPAAISISINETDFKDGNLDDIFSTDKKYNFTVNMKNQSKAFLYKYKIESARLLSQSYSNSIGDVSSVDLEFSCDVTPFEGLSISNIA